MNDFMNDPAVTGFEKPVNNTKEGHMRFLQERIDARSKRIDALTQQICKMQDSNSRDLIRLEELRLLRDIRDGRVTLIHTESGKPITVHVFKTNA